MTEKKSTWAIVVAAGRGTRFGKPYNKVFHLLNGQSILGHALRALAAADVFDGVVLVISEQDAASFRELAVRERLLPLVSEVVYGGDTRQESVMNGLKVLPEDACIVAVHDAARPFAAPSLIRELIKEASVYGASVPGVPLTDTIKELDGEGFAVCTADRSLLCAVQTPQVFRFNRLMDAHRRAEEEGVSATDDATLFEKYIGRVKVVMQPECMDNIKVTTQRDLGNSLRIPRIGQGYDAHRLVEGRSLVLCGVEIPYNKGLLGHSDADVAIHALMDALLGAAALGDIGRHFPDSDVRYKGISSMKLLGYVMERLNERGLCPMNVDVTIVAQRPKLKGYIGEMKSNLCEVLKLDDMHVNVKATTTEGMGFEGQEIGISAQAVALLMPT